VLNSDYRSDAFDRLADAAARPDAGEVPWWADALAVVTVGVVCCSAGWGLLWVLDTGR
jgi:hypothetical protein